MSVRAVVALVVSIVAVAGACSDSGSDEVASTDATPEASTGSVASTAPPVASSTPSGDVATTTPDATPDATTAAATTSTIPPTTTTEPARPFGDVAPIEPSTPTENNEPTPMLAWPPVDGAGSYTVLVRDAEGAGWWAWEGVETEVVLGGVADGPGALVVRPGTTWTVIAFDAGGAVLAASQERRLDP